MLKLFRDAGFADVDFCQHDTVTARRLCNGEHKTWCLSQTRYLNVAAAVRKGPLSCARNCCIESFTTQVFE